MHQLATGISAFLSRSTHPAFQVLHRHLGRWNIVPGYQDTADGCVRVTISSGIFHTKNRTVLQTDTGRSLNMDHECFDSVPHPKHWTIKVSQLALLDAFPVRVGLVDAIGFLERGRQLLGKIRTKFQALRAHDMICGQAKQGFRKIRCFRQRSRNFRLIVTCDETRSRGSSRIGYDFKTVEVLLKKTAGLIGIGSSRHCSSLPACLDQKVRTF